MFTGDPQKAILNYEKHAVSFEEAATIFSDSKGLEWEDPEHSGVEPRLKRVGISQARRILMLVYTLRRTKSGNEAICIISARQASRKERKAYAGSHH
jgi:hypothetical protein